MSHEAIRKIVGPSMVQLRMADLVALLADRDALADEVERLKNRVDWEVKSGIAGLTPIQGYRSAPAQYGLAEEDVPPFIRDHVRTPEAVDGVDEVGGNGDGADIVPNGQPTAPIEPDAKGDAGSGRPPAAPPCCDGYPWCDCDEASKEPEQPEPSVETLTRADGSIEGGWDIQDGDEMVTVNVDPSPGDCSCVILDQTEQAAVDSIQSERAATLGQDIERAVCGSRQPPSQEAELVAPVLPAQSFVEDRKDETSGAKVVPWKASYTPDKCLLAIRMLAEGSAAVTVAAGTGLEKITVSDINKQYRTQIEHASEMDDFDRERFFASMYRQFISRWVAAGNEAGVQPDGPPKKKTPLVEAARRDYKSKGEKVQP